MVSDANKGITDIGYDFLNLPTKITVSGPNNGTVSYIYGATGIKLKKTVGTGSTTEYAGNYIYENGNLKQITQSEGYIEPNGTGWQYVYRYTDIWGNTRLTYADDDNDGNIDASSEIRREQNYYPFGLEHKGYNNVSSSSLAEKWKYNGKELNESLGLNWYDYGARNYDAALGRWMNTDPLAEKYETLSPYTYVANNPINAVDPDGRLIVYVNGLLFDQAAEWKLNPINWLGTAISSKYRYNPESWATRISKNEVRFNNQQIDYWGKVGSGGTRDIINDHYGDYNNVFVNGTNHFKSQAPDRFALGRKAGVELIAQLQNGTIELENEETIKIVGHSQGAAFAAGMLTELMNSDYAKRVEAGIYLSPHQPGGFTHPDGVLGAQFSTLSDWVSSSGGFMGAMNLFNGGSEFSEIEGADFLFIRANHDGGKGGHNVETWNAILQRISDFLNNDDDED